MSRGLRARCALGVAIAAVLALAAIGDAAPRPLKRDMTPCMGLKPTKPGTARADVLLGTPHRDVFQGGGGNDRIRGLGGDDVICGGSGNDTISAGAGNDKVDAGAGNDTVSGGAGNDRVLGRSGNDVLTGDAGDDRLSGQAGTDTVSGGDGADTATGGSGTDNVTGGAGNDVLGGGRGTDTLDGGDGDDQLYGGAGHDTLFPGTGADKLYGGEGADDIMPGDGPSQIVPDPENGTSDPGDPSLAPGEDVTVPDQSAEALLGPDATPTDIVPAPQWNDHVDPGGGNDTVAGSPGADTVTASDGADTISGGDGNDHLDGGAGADTISGGNGADTISGGDGNDPSLAGGDGADTIDGGAGNDPSISGGDGQDTIAGGGGDDNADGGAGADTIDGGPGADTIDGGVGGDTVTGGPDDASDGADTISGGDSVDKLTGGGGNDVMNGGPGADAMFGQSGDDQLNGGPGSDDAYGQAGGGDVCLNNEQAFGCETVTGVKDNSLVRDAPSSGGACDAWASNSGDDQAAGTALAPYRTVERLVNALRPGETGCLVGGQTFEEPDFEIHVRGSGDRGNPITIRTGPGAGSGSTPLATVKGRMWIDQVAHDIVFENLAIDGENPLAALRGPGAALPSPTVNGNRISFLHDDITTNKQSTCVALGSFEGVYGEADGTVIRGNRIHDCGVPTPPTQNSGDNGIDLEGSLNAVIADNYVYNNSDRGILLWGDAQGTRVSDNVITGNRIDVHIGTAVFNGADLVPDDNRFTNNVIAAGTLARNGGAWEVEGGKDRSSAPNPSVGNLVDANCFWNKDPSKDIQQPPVVFTDGGNNLAGPPPAGQPQPAAGPGFAGAGNGDFRLTGAPGTCPRTYGPEDPPAVDTQDASDVTGSSATVGYTATDRSRGVGSTVWVEWRRDGGGGTDGQATAPVPVAVGATASARVPLSGLEPGVTYRYRAVAQSASGLVYGPEKTVLMVSPAPGPRVLPPPGDTTVNLVGAVPSLVKVRLRDLDEFFPLPDPAQVPLGSEVDATRAGVQVALGGAGGTGIASTAGGVFLMRQPTPRLADFRLTKQIRCGRRKRSRGGRDTARLSVRYERRGNRKVSVSGRFASAGPQVSATFSVANLCEGTRVAVQQGSVTVTDPKGHLVKTVRAGHAYLRRGNR